ncbi:winged helix-turn-helix domain-containing protein [Neomicrococcus lactis]|uniref:winged helix-turn-helix domain-containing protein n=1 Tax=Neomicrococcus lactis TaxID=732241 RepID=UPI002FE34396
MTLRTIPAPQARRIALAAQGLHQERISAPASTRSLGREFRRLHLLQIDSVNVLTRSHYLPLFSRLGNYDIAAFEAMAHTAPRSMIEYWAHEASYIRPDHFHDLRRLQSRKWVGSHQFDPVDVAAAEDAILQLLAHSGPQTNRQIEVELSHLIPPRDPDAPKDWGWNWSNVKRALEILFERGLVSSAGRNSSFERRYALTEKVLPPAVRAAFSPEVSPNSEDDDAARRRLLTAASEALGIGTARHLADYFRIKPSKAQPILDRMVADGTLESVVVPVWKEPAYLNPAAKSPRTAKGRAVLSPFDSMVFERHRLETLFGMRYRLEIYTPAPKRQFGYYVLPFLLRDGMVARVDLKSDRAARKLLVPAAHAEEGAPGDTAAELAAELELLAQWLGLDGVVVTDSGDLAPSLIKALG